MKNLFVVGNWKSFKTTTEAHAWFEEFSHLHEATKIAPHVKIILSPAFTLLPFCKDKIDEYKLPIELAGQDVSGFDEGAFTGEVNASQLREFAAWTLIGHVERRKHLGETDMALFQKASRAKLKGLGVIYCVQDEAVDVPPEADIISYEPAWAISTASHSHPQLPESANRVAAAIEKYYSGKPIIYGGSTNPENVASFLRQPAISGVLPGAASLEAKKFFDMVALASLVT